MDAIMRPYLFKIGTKCKALIIGGKKLLISINLYHVHKLEILQLYPKNIIYIQYLGTKCKI